MKVFYEQDGNVVGTLEGANQDIEKNATMPGYEETRAPVDIAQRILNPNDPLLHTDLAVEDGRVIVANPDRL